MLAEVLGVQLNFVPCGAAAPVKLMPVAGAPLMTTKAVLGPKF
jgi:hypothetical protein